MLGIGTAATVATMPGKVEAPRVPTPTDVSQFFEAGHGPKLETKMMPTNAMQDAWNRANKPGAEKRKARRHHKQRVTKESQKR